VDEEVTDQTELSPREQRDARIPTSVPHTTAASEFLYGKSVTIAALKAQRRKLYNLYIHPRAESSEHEQSDNIRRLAKRAGVKVTTVGDNYLPVMDKMSKQRPHNGCVLETSPLPKYPAQSLLPSVRGTTFAVMPAAQSAEEAAINGRSTEIVYTSKYSAQPDTRRHPFILFLDSIKDPGNLGAIIRSAYFLGVDAVALSKHTTAPLTPVALKAAAGAAEALPIVVYESPTTFLDSSIRNGWKVYAAVAPGSTVEEVSLHTRDYKDKSTRKREAAERKDKKEVARQVDSSLASATTSGGLITFTTAKAPYSEKVNHTPLTRGPTILCLGEEGEGVKQAVLKRAHYYVGIRGARTDDDIGVDSLNVSVAAAVLGAEFMRPPTRKPASTTAPEPIDAEQSKIESGQIQSRRPQPTKAGDNVNVSEEVVDKDVAEGTNSDSKGTLNEPDEQEESDEALSRTQDTDEKAENKERIF